MNGIAKMTDKISKMGRIDKVHRAESFVLVSRNKRVLILYVAYFIDMLYLQALS